MYGGSEPEMWEMACGGVAGDSGTVALAAAPEGLIASPEQPTEQQGGAVANIAAMLAEGGSVAGVSAAPPSESVVSGADSAIPDFAILHPKTSAAAPEGSSTVVTNSGDLLPGVPKNKQPLIHTPRGRQVASQMNRPRTGGKPIHQWAPMQMQSLMVSASEALCMASAQKKEAWQMRHSVAHCSRQWVLMPPPPMQPVK